MPPRQRAAVPVPPRFNPLDPAEIGQVLRRKIESFENPAPFPPDRFGGAGLYALYYVGDFPLYAPLRGTRVPIYVGKAEASNSSYGYEPNYGQPKLRDRINKHARSVREVQTSPHGNLNTGDFRVRYLSLEDAWIVLGERALLRSYRPVLWNTLMSGFGSNEPGTDRTNARSVWDTIHPGRRRAGIRPNRSFTQAEMQARIARGIEISLMANPDEQRVAIEEMNANRPPVIWAPAPAADRQGGGDHDPRLRVAQIDRFEGELRGLGLELVRNVHYVEVNERLEEPEAEEVGLEVD